MQLGPTKGSVADAHHVPFNKCQWWGHAIIQVCQTGCGILGLQVPRVRFLITQNPNKVLDTDHKTRFPRIVGWNLVKLVYQEFLKNYSIDVFEDFECPDGVNPLLFPSCVFITMLKWYQLW